MLRDNPNFGRRSFLPHGAARIAGVGLALILPVAAAFADGLEVRDFGGVSTDVAGLGSNQLQAVSETAQLDIADFNAAVSYANDTAGTGVVTLVNALPDSGAGNLVIDAPGLGFDHPTWADANALHLTAAEHLWVNAPIAANSVTGAPLNLVFNANSRIQIDLGAALTLNGGDIQFDSPGETYVSGVITGARNLEVNSTQGVFVSEDLSASGNISFASYSYGYNGGPLSTRSLTATGPDGDNDVSFSFEGDMYVDGSISGGGFRVGTGSGNRYQSLHVTGGVDLTGQVTLSNAGPTTIDGPVAAREFSAYANDPGSSLTLGALTVEDQVELYGIEAVVINGDLQTGSHFVSDASATYPGGADPASAVFQAQNVTVAGQLQLRHHTIEIMGDLHVQPDTDWGATGGIDSTGPGIFNAWQSVTVGQGHVSIEHDAVQIGGDVVSTSGDVRLQGFGGQVFVQNITATAGEITLSTLGLSGSEAQVFADTLYSSAGVNVEVLGDHAIEINNVITQGGISIASQAGQDRGITVGQLSAEGGIVLRHGSITVNDVRVLESFEAYSPGVISVNALVAGQVTIGEQHAPAAYFTANDKLEPGTYQSSTSSQVYVSGAVELYGDLDARNGGSFAVYGAQRFTAYQSVHADGDLYLEADEVEIHGDASSDSEVSIRAQTATIHGTVTGQALYLDVEQATLSAANAANLGVSRGNVVFVNTPTIAYGSVYVTGGGTINLGSVELQSESIEVGVDGVLAGVSITTDSGVSGLNVDGVLRPDDGDLGRSATLSVQGGATLGTLGVYEWTLNDVNGSAGDMSGWDLLVIQEPVEWLAGFAVRLVGLSNGDPGTPEGFDPQAAYRFTIAQFLSGVVDNGVAVTDLRLELAGLWEGPGQWWLEYDFDLNELQLVYDVIPEPSAAAVLALAGLVALRRRRVW